MESSWSELRNVAWPCHRSVRNGFGKGILWSKRCRHRWCGHLRLARLLWVQLSQAALRVRLGGGERTRTADFYVANADRPIFWPGRMRV